MKKNDKEKLVRYADHHLQRFRDDSARLQALLEKANARLEIAERQHAAGEMVTGTEDGVPDMLRGLIPPYT